jgi:hypothetical protein
MTSSQNDDIYFRENILKAETAAILADPSFRRSPTLSKLLQFLVNETLEGRGETLKSYTLAVDALGRPNDYDSSSDSSARVQMIRLRKALESYYAKIPPIEKLCIYLQSGSYLVRADEPSIAYPTLYRLNAGTGETEPTDRLEPVRLRPPVSFSPRAPSAAGTASPALTWKWKQWTFAAVVAVIAAAAIVTIYRISNAVTGPAYESPVVRIMPIDDNGRPELAGLSGYLRNVYEGDLPRFKLARVRLAEDSSTNGGQENERYHLNSRIVPDGQLRATLFLNLDDVRSNTVIWTQNVSLPLDPAEARQTIVPLLGEINGPVGAIALHQTGLTQNIDAGGFPCLLKYFEFIRTRRPDLEERVASCLAKPVEEEFIEATMLGVRALFQLERPAAQKKFETATTSGLALARQAVAADPNDGWANFAMARLSFAARDCRSTIVYTQRTMAANPNSPVFPAVLASLTPECKYPGAVDILDQALLTQNPLYIRSRLILVQAAIFNKQPQKIALIKDSELPETNVQKRYYYATETFIAASKGETDEANRNWRLFNSVSDPDAATSDARLSSIIIIPTLRDHALDYLREAGVAL